MEENKKSRKAILMCANWLSYCLSIGWSKSDIPQLEKLWWKGHNWTTGDVDLSNF